MATKYILGSLFLTICLPSLSANSAVSINDMASAIEHVISDMRDQQAKYEESLNERDKKIAEATLAISSMKREIDELKKFDEGFIQTSKELTKDVSALKEKQKLTNDSPKISVDIIPIVPAPKDSIGNELKTLKNAVARTELKIRKSPSLKSYVVGYLTKGELVKASEHVDSNEVENGFSRINRGWVSSKYLNFQEYGVKR